MRSLLPLPPVFLALAASALACETDPVHAAAVDHLPPEAAGVAVGPYHRAGQPCATCHGDQGPASQPFAVAGTVFFGPGTSAPLVGVGNALVLLEDDSQATFMTTTNCVGNFFVRPSEWPGHPQYPLIVRVVGQAQQQHADVAMQSRIGRTASCATCHQIPTGDNLDRTPGVVHLAPQDDLTFTGDPGCPVNPILGQ
jgi:cytochrome c553